MGKQTQQNLILHLEDEPQWTRRVQLVLGDSFSVQAATDLEHMGLAVIKQHKDGETFKLFIIDANIQAYPDSQKEIIAPRDSDYHDLEDYGLTEIVTTTSTESEPNAVGLSFLNTLDPHLGRLGYAEGIKVIVLSGNAADYHHMLNQRGEHYEIIGVFDKGDFVEQADAFLSLVLKQQRQD